MKRNCFLHDMLVCDNRVITAYASVCQCPFSHMNVERCESVAILVHDRALEEN